MWLFFLCKLIDWELLVVVFMNYVIAGLFGVVWVEKLWWWWWWWWVVSISHWTHSLLAFWPVTAGANGFLYPPLDRTILGNLLKTAKFQFEFASSATRSWYGVWWWLSVILHVWRVCALRWKRGWIDGQSGVAHSHRQTLTVVQLFVLKAGQKQAKGSQLELVQLDNWHRSVLLCFVYLVEWFSANKTHCWHVCWDIISHERSFLFRFAKCTVHTLFSECIINLLGSGSSSFEPPFTIFPTFDSIHFISFNSILYTFISYYL